LCIASRLPHSAYFKSKDDLIGAIILEMMSFVAGAAAMFSEPLPEGRLRRPGEALAEIVIRYQDFELGTVVERARIFPHLVGEQQRNPELNAAVRAGLEGLRAGFETLARAAQERAELDPELDPQDFSRLPISLLQGLLIQLSVFGDEIDIDAYARAATALIAPAAGGLGPAKGRASQAAASALRQKASTRAFQSSGTSWKG
jgi:AcrR family transcriptional regulator